MRSSCSICQTPQLGTFDCSALRVANLSLHKQTGSYKLTQNHALERGHLRCLRGCIGRDGTYWYHAPRQVGLTGAGDACAAIPIWAVIVSRRVRQSANRAHNLPSCRSSRMATDEDVVIRTQIRQKHAREVSRRVKVA